MRRTTSLNSKVPQPLYTLHERHSQFHKFLDRLAAKVNDTAEIELILGLREFNMDCLTKYADLIVRNDISLDKPMPQHRYPFNGGLEESNMTLWNIHGQLMRFIPIYAEALRNEELSRVAKSIVASNYERLIRLKDDLLHPVSSAELIHE